MGYGARRFSAFGVHAQNDISETVKTRFWSEYILKLGSHQGSACVFQRNLTVF